MKIHLLAFAILLLNVSIAQNINYKVEIVQLKITGCDDGFGDDEEPTWKVWGRDNINTAWQGGICQSSDGNAPHIFIPSGGDELLLNTTNTSATLVEIKFEAWEDDNFSNSPGSPDRCSFDSGDDCHQLLTPIAGNGGIYSAISIMAGAACTWTSYTYAAGDWEVTVRITWEYSTFDGGPSIVACDPDPAQLSAQGSGIWSIFSGTGGGFSSNSDPEALFTGNSGVTYELLWSTPAGCLTQYTPDTVTVYVYNAPVPNLQSSGSTFCEGTEITFDAQDGLSYQFSVNTLSNVVETNATGTFNYTPVFGDSVVYVMATNANCSGLDSIEFEVQDAPEPQIIMVGSSLSSTSVFPFYQWYLNGLSITGATTGTYTPTQNGIYTLEVGLTNGCTETTDFNLTNISVEESHSVFKLYPNPVGDILVIEGIDSKTVSYQIFDKVGKLIATETTSGIIDVSTVDAGSYIIRLMTQEGFSYIHKIEIIK